MSLCILIILPFDTRFSAEMGICSVQEMKMVYSEKELLQYKGFEPPFQWKTTRSTSLSENGAGLQVGS